ncbi:MAG: phosphate ABC transporter substrate-binding protein [Eubacterium sp.]|nr:phosphate ABC transporter substrate-binding protein [Eubacterium sp.]
MLLCVLSHLTGCGISNNTWAKDQSRTITMAGSTSMEKLADALAESFMEEYPNVTVTVEFTGSSAGIESVLTGTADIGISSRTLKEEEKALGAVENIVAIEGIAVVTDTANKVTSLTLEQLTDIYTGKIRNWSRLGGADKAIVVIGREAGSGTRETFEKLLEVEYMCAYANELDSTGAVMARTASTPGAIGYVSRDVLNDSVQVLAIDGLQPTDQHILKGSYPLSRPLVMVTKGKIADQKNAARELFMYLHSKKGRKLIKSAGLIVPDQGD